MVNLQAMQNEERAMDTIPEERFYSLEVQMEVDVHDPYCDVPVESVDDVLAWDEPVENLRNLLVEVQVLSMQID